MNFLGGCFLRVKQGQRVINVLFSLIIEHGPTSFIAPTEYQICNAKKNDIIFYHHFTGD